MQEYWRSYLEQLEAEAVYVIREAAGQFEHPALLFSGGKDSIVLSWLARRAFAPGPIPFPLLHIDTGHNFPETLEFRDRFVAELGARLVVGSVAESIERGRVPDEASRNSLQSVTLLDTIATQGFDACLGGARRDEEKARAKERFFSHRNAFGQWDPKSQRPEIWSLLNGRKSPGEHFRVFPLSNWTELDVWHYLRAQQIPLPGLYFSHRRPVFRRGGMLLAHCDLFQLQPGETVETLAVRFRTLGDITCSGAMESHAANVDEVLAEVAAARLTERGGRSDDKRSEDAMEDRKREGYF